MSESKHFGVEGVWPPIAGLRANLPPTGGPPMPKLEGDTNHAVFAVWSSVVFIAGGLTGFIVALLLR